MEKSTVFVKLELMVNLDTDEESGKYDVTNVKYSFN